MAFKIEKYKINDNCTNVISHKTLRHTGGVRLVTEGAGGGRKLSLPFNLSARANQSGSYAGSSKTSLFGLTTGFTE